MMYCGPFEHDRYLATRSSDGGKTWSVVAEMPVGHVELARYPGERFTAFNECHCLEVEPDHIICAMRSTDEPMHVFLTRTRDGGRTWSIPQDLGVYGYPPSLAKLSSGAVLCVFSDRREPNAIRGIVSYDHAATWDVEHVITIREFEYKADMGYPMAVETSPGELLCAYYYVPLNQWGAPAPALENVPPDQAGILMTRFRLALPGLAGELLLMNGAKSVSEKESHKRVG